MKDSKFINGINEKGKMLFNRKIEEKEISAEANSPSVPKQEQFDETILQDPFKVFYEMNYVEEVKEMIKQNPNVNESRLKQINRLNEPEFQHLGKSFKDEIMNDPFIKNPDLMDPINKKLVYEYRLALAENFSLITTSIERIYE